MMAADFDGDGKIDVGILYDYGNNDTAVLVFANTGSGFAAPSVWWNSGAGNWAWGSSTPLVGDFNGDGKPDVMVMYDYGSSDMGLLLLPNTGTSFGTVQSWYRSRPGGINAGAAWPIVGDFYRGHRAVVHAPAAVCAAGASSTARRDSCAASRVR
jgi:hypothetical protein